MNWLGIFNCAASVLGFTIGIVLIALIAYINDRVDKKYGQETCGGIACGGIIVLTMLFGLIGTPLSYYMIHRNDPKPHMEVESSNGH